MEPNTESDSDKASFWEPLLSIYLIVYFKQHASSSALPFCIEMLQKLLDYDSCWGVSLRDLNVLIITLRLTKFCFNMQTELSFMILSLAFIICFYSKRFINFSSNSIKSVMISNVRVDFVLGWTKKAAAFWLH